MERTTKTTEKIFRDHKITITVEDIKKAFDIPAHVQILVPLQDNDGGIGFGYMDRWTSLYGGLKAEWVDEEIVKQS
jgi:hypothetical protein